MSDLVSVVIPVFNGAKFVAEAVETVLAQEGVNVDVIVVDDGSTDDTVATLAPFGDSIRVESRANRGAATARNVGLSLARGEWIALLDSDDLWKPGKLRLQLDHLIANPAAAGCVTYSQNFFSEGELRISHQRLDVPVPAYSLSALLARRSAFDRIGSFDASMQTSDTFDWFVRARERGERIDLLPDVMLFRRLHDANSSRRRAGLAKDELVNTLKAALDRRRRASLSLDDTES